MIQKITQNNGNFGTVNLIMRAKIVNQSSDFPVRRTGSYRHKKALSVTIDENITADGHYTECQHKPSLPLTMGDIPKCGVTAQTYTYIF